MRDDIPFPADIRKPHYDGLRQTIRNESCGGAEEANVYSVPVYMNTLYDRSGRVWKKSLPYFTGDSPFWATSTYDPLGRLLTQVNPDTATTTFFYAGNPTTTTDPEGNRRIEKRNAYGRTVRITEYKDSSSRFDTAFDYDAHGNLKRINAAHGKQTIVACNSLSRRTGMEDPATGYRSYNYDANGNLTGQTDAKLNTIAVEYDELNRPHRKRYCPLQRACYDGVIYDHDNPAMANGKGRLTTVTDLDASGAPVCITSYSQKV